MPQQAHSIHAEVPSYSKLAHCNWWPSYAVGEVGQSSSCELKVVQDDNRK